jgi:peptidoglycan-N-acetylglucosamine deacetylase
MPARGIVGALAGVAVCLSVAAAAGSADSKGIGDPDDARGPLDIARVQVAQSGPKLSLRVQTFEPWEASALEGNPALDPRSPESYLCLEFADEDDRSRSCLTTGAGGEKRLTQIRIGSSGDVASRRRLDAKIERGGDRSFRASFRFGDVGLGPGGFGWRAISGWGNPSCAPPAHGPAPVCTDVAPDDGAIAKGKLRRPHVVGCTHRGPLVRHRGGGQAKQVALTFDDGPSPFTSGVIKALDRHGARGTFFAVGQEVAGRQSALRRALRHGHEIGNHTMHHQMLPPTSDLRATSSLIRRTTGFKPCSFRPPGGALSLGLARGARAAGMTTVLWDVDTRDWSGVGSATIKARATAVRPGSIVLMHDGGGNRAQTVVALPSIISELKRRGFELVTVSRLLGQRMKWRPR